MSLCGVQGECPGVRRSRRYIHRVSVPYSGGQVCGVLVAVDADELRVCALPTAHQCYRRCRSLRYTVKFLLSTLLDHSSEKLCRS